MSFPHIRSGMRAVLFDLDGTLVSSSLDFARIRAELNCPAGVDVLDFIDALAPDEQLAAHRIVQRHELEDAQAAVAMPGVQKLISGLDELGLKTGIVTRNARETTRHKLAKTGLEFDHVITREDALPKPHPEALIMLSQKWAVDPAQCLYIGDFRYDIEAAHNAGMLSGFYLQEGDALPEYARQADLLVRHWDQLLEALESLLRNS